MTLPDDLLADLGVPPPSPRGRQGRPKPAPRNSITAWRTQSAPPCEDCGKDVAQSLLDGATPAAPLHVTHKVTFASGSPDRGVCYKHAETWRRALGLTDGRRRR